MFGGTLKTVVLDSHVLHWWSIDDERMSRTATNAIIEADELVVADVTWYELAWLAHRGRIELHAPVSRWLEGLASQVRSVPLTPQIAMTAAALPATFPADPADRVIYATAVELGVRLVTRDERIRAHRSASRIALW